LIKVLIADDSSFMREVIKDILEKQDDIEVVGEAENGDTAVAKYRELDPDVVTLDIVMPDSNGINALEKILKINSNAVAIMITSIGQEKYVKQCLDMGAKGFIIKPFAEEDVLETIRMSVS